MGREGRQEGECSGEECSWMYLAMIDMLRGKEGDGNKVRSHQGRTDDS